MSSDPRHHRVTTLISPRLRRIIEFAALLLTLCSGIVAIVKSAGAVTWAWILLLIVLMIFLVVYIFNQRKYRRAELDLDQLRADAASTRAALDNAAKELKRRQDNEIRMIHPRQYMDVLERLASKHGKGDLLLFNVELNSFIDNEVFAGLWKHLAEVPDLNKVKLALPPAKYERWVRIVTGDRADFFRESTNADKFLACRYDGGLDHGEDRIAFALYEKLGAPETAWAADWAAVFLVNRPFVVRRPDEGCNYLSILEYNGPEHDEITLCGKLWHEVYSDVGAESARVIAMANRGCRAPTRLEDLLKAHDCAANRAEELRRIVGGRRTIEADGMQPRPPDLAHARPLEDGRIGFTVRYNPQGGAAGQDVDTIHGWCLGLPKDGKVKPRPCMIWATGFGDGYEPRVAKLLSRMIREEEQGIVEVFYTKSGAIAETTCTHLYEDLENVLDYVEHIPQVDRDRVCVVGISICGFLAAKLAQVDRRVRTLILVAPPFDVIDMLDNFRKHRFERQKMGLPPTFEDFLKGKANLRITNWDRNPCYCDYFGQVVTSSHLVDIAVQGPLKFRREAFLKALSDITSDARRVALIYSDEDPIVNPKQNMGFLNRAVEAGHIQPGWMEIREIPVAHFYPDTGHGGEYPMEFGNKRKILKDMAEAIRHCLGVVIEPDLVARCADDLEDGGHVISMQKAQKAG